MNKLKTNYEAACMAYINEFAQKQNLEFTEWLGDEVGIVAIFEEEIILNFSDIVHDIDNEVQPRLIIKWNYDSMENHTKRINYKSFCMGLRFSDI